MDWPTVYKIVTKKYDKYYSTIYHLGESCITNKFVTEYIPGEFVKPKIDGTVLYCFDSLEAAKSFAKDCGSGFGGMTYELWEATGKHARFDEDLLPTMYLKDFELKWMKNQKILSVARFHGTLMCDELRLDRKIEL